METERTLMEGLIHYFSILRKYRWVVIGITAGAALGVIAFCAASVLLPPNRSPLPNTYTASAVILVHQGAEGELSQSIRTALGITGTQADSGTGFDNGAFLTMLLQSRTMLDKVVDEFGIINKYGVIHQEKSASRRMIRSKLRFDNNVTTGTLTISCTDTDPVFARDVANRLVSLLQEWYAQNLGSTAQQQTQLLEEKINEVQTDIDKLQQQLGELQKKYGVMTAQDLDTSQASALAALRSQLILKDIDIKNYADTNAPQDARMSQLKRERQEILDLINRMQQGMAAGSENDPGSNSFADVQAEFNNLTVELDIQRKIYNTLSHQTEVLKLTSNSAPPFQVMELAEVPDAKSGPQRVRIVEEVIGIALVISVFLAFFLNAVSEAGTRKKSHLPRTRSQGI
jgi:tyrosine-protein kinase Etk/Wzc